MAEDSSSELTATPNNLDITTNSEDYVRISRSEYEDIKNRVSNIESRISSEFENIIGVSMSDLEMTPNKSVVSNLKTVQSVYERTLESAEKLNGSASDELARRLGKELKIRDSLEKKVMRSPSARKIGSLRRRSKENIPLIKRNLSLNVPDRWNSHQFYPLNGLRRGKPNTVFNGLPEPVMAVTDKTEGQFKNFTNQLQSETFEPSDFDLSSFGVLTRSQARRASSFHGCDLSKGPSKVLSHLENNNHPINATSWKSADDFLKEEKVEEKPVTGRPSLAKIRSQNAGMVLAKAKLFNTIIDDGDKVEMKAFKTAKSSSVRSQELKKRNSSKSSKERNLQKTDSRNGSCRQKKEQPDLKQSIKASTNTPKKSDALEVSKKEKLFANYTGKENMAKTHPRMLQSSLPITPSHSSKPTQSPFTSAKQCKRGMSPFNENYRNVSSVHNSSALVGRSPNVARSILSKSGASPMKTNSSTPRRSPRTMMLKARHVNKH